MKEFLMKRREEAIMKITVLVVIGLLLLFPTCERLYILTNFFFRAIITSKSKY